MFRALAERGAPLVNVAGKQGRAGDKRKRDTKRERKEEKERNMKIRIRTNNCMHYQRQSDRKHRTDRKGGRRRLPRTSGKGKNEYSDKVVSNEKHIY
jgi:hypothetical protein